MNAIALAGKPRTDAGAFERLGLWTADRFRLVAGAWLLILVGLGALAPFAEGALSGAGWQVSGSSSLAARGLLERSFPAASPYALQVVISRADAGAIRRVRAVLARDAAVGGVHVVARGGDTFVVQGDAAAGPTEMVRAAERLEPRVRVAAGPGSTARISGTAAMWADFNHANKKAMLRSELLSWPLTLALLVLAFGSLVAAALPLLLTIVGLASAAGALFLVAHFLSVSIWAMNFALMFSLALGIDYALFLLTRYPAALAQGLPAREAVGVAMATAGKAVFASGLTVIAALSAVMLVPSPNFRSVPLGIDLSVVFVLIASLTLLPAVLSRLGGALDRGRLPYKSSVEYRSARFERWGARLWRRPALALVAVSVLAVLATPASGLRTGMPSILVLPKQASSRQGFDTLRRQFGAGALAPIQVVAPSAAADRAASVLRADPGIARVAAPLADDGRTLLTATPRAEPATRPLSATLDRVRRALPQGALLGGAAAENRDLERALVRRAPLAIGLVLAIGFLLLLGLLRAPLVAAAAVVLNLFATAAAFGVATLIFQDGYLQHLLRFHSQGFVDAWAPIFFFAMIFALAMDYTVFLLATVKEHLERDGNPRTALIRGLGDSGRVINAAGAVMVVVFLTFALSGPIPPKEMGIVLAVAVLLDMSLVRLLLLPVTLRLLGTRAWWLPDWLDRALPRARFAH